ncbi:hypothetical protein [Nocardia transvalensis]|uniref:hypothetical protein n=1 Tax=Nocardia transvalensis TaxID=37333 RepID=UPI0018937E58|nr:hypothetical protein [Nocardia transvalensis]MBF6328715.1 hypothetical protein [Nocardia transvalensis]
MRIFAVVLSVGAAVVLAGCNSGNGPQAPTLSPIPTQQSTTSSAAPPKSQRNNIVKHIGEESGIGKPGQAPVVRWTITDLTVDAPCTSPFAKPPEKGHFVVATVEAETTPDFEIAALPGGFLPRNNWAIVDANGITQPQADSISAQQCRDYDVPESLVPGSKYSFHLVFDSRTQTGVLTFVPLGRSGGWEWSF